jgi:iron(III) transport system substrate-binding protein
MEHTVKGATYNTKMVSPNDVPRSWEDLLDPRWKGKIALEINMDVFIYLTTTWGEEKMIAYLKKLREQAPIFTQGVTQTMTLLTAGEFPIAVSMSLHRTLILQAQGAPVAFAPISPVADEFVAYVTVVDAPHPNSAKLFLRWLMTTEAQSMVDKIRRKGNPLPGSGTLQSKAIEQLGLKVQAAPSWDYNFERLGQLYHMSLGVTKETKVLQQKKN